MIENNEHDMLQDLQDSPLFGHLQKSSQRYSDVLTDEEKELIDLELEEMFTPEELQKFKQKLEWLYKRYREVTMPTYIGKYNEFTLENNNYLDPKFYRKSPEFSPEDQKNLENNAFDFFQTELNNIKLAISYAKEERQWQRIVEICQNLQRFLKIRTYWEDLEDILKEAIYAANESGERLTKAHLLNQFAGLQRLLGRAKEGLDKCEESLHIFQELKDEYGEAKALYTLGFLNRSLGKWEKSAEALENSVKLFRKIQESQNLDINVEEDIAEALDALGLVYPNLGKLESAKQVLQESLEFKKKLNDRFELSKTTNILGKVYIELYNSQKKFEFLQEGQKLMESSLEIKKEFKDFQGQGTCFNELGKIQRLMGNYEQALQYYLKSLDVKKKVSSTGGGASDRHGEGLTYMEMGFCFQDQGKRKEAQNTFRKALDYLNVYSPQYEEVSKIFQENS
jgi:tetratricopeptide (TPR) repeat protein